MISVTYRRTEGRNCLVELADGVTAERLVAGLRDRTLTRASDTVVDAAGKTVACIHDDMPDASDVEDSDWNWSWQGVPE